MHSRWHSRLSALGMLSVLGVLGVAAQIPARALAQMQPGHPIGKVTTRDKLIVLELDTGVIAPEHLFDLDHRTLRFTPDGGKYRIQNVRLVWDSTFGDPMQGGTVPLRKFNF